MLWKISFIFAFLVLEGCASQVPLLIRETPPENPSLNAVQEDISRYKGSHVRWGGTIASVQNKKDTTIIEIVALKLGDEGRPEEADRSPGRFWALIGGFLDPTIYRHGREITVYGTVKRLAKSHIGEHLYLFPVIQVETYYLWEIVEARPYYPPYGLFSPYGLYGPYGYGLYGFPYGPYGFYPFWYYW
jgi:outer membrane lipoprotein